ncbi:hypothetical protein A9X82_04805 [Brachyspira hyodysenteriae]|nr:hypothetical protein A9X82_04805 [Brachyspira hyodysenteriae]
MLKVILCVLKSIPNVYILLSLKIFVKLFYEKIYIKDIKNIYEKIFFKLIFMYFWYLLKTIYCLEIFYM